MGTFSSVTSETVAAELSASGSSGSSGRCCDSSENVRRQRRHYRSVQFSMLATNFTRTKPTRFPFLFGPVVYDFVRPRCPESATGAAEIYCTWPKLDRGAHSKNTFWDIRQTWFVSQIAAKKCSIHADPM